MNNENKLCLAVVDDERHILDRISRILEENFPGLFDVIKQENAESVIEELKRREIAIIISDIKMPGMNGLDFMKYVHAHYPDTKFLLFSAYPDFEYIYEANLYGIKYLLKIEDDNVIVQTIADLLSTEAKADEEVVPTSNDQLIQFIVEYIEKHYNTDLSLEMLAEIVHFNPSYLSRIFKQHTGQNIFQYVNVIRLRESKSLLSETNFKITEISEMIGYKSSNYFCYVFKQATGMSPQLYRKNSVMKP